MIRSWRCMVCLRDSNNICGVGDVKSVKRQWKTPEGRLVLDICCRSPGIVHTIRDITISFTFLLTQATLAEIALASGCGWMSVQRRWLSGLLDILKFALEKWPWFILYNVKEKRHPCVCVGPFDILCVYVFPKGLSCADPLGPRVSDALTIWRLQACGVGRPQLKWGSNKPDGKMVAPTFVFLCRSRENKATPTPPNCLSNIHRVYSSKIW